LQIPRQKKIDNLNNVRRDISITLREKSDYIKGTELMSLRQEVRTEMSETYM